MFHIFPLSSWFYFDRRRMPASASFRHLHKNICFHFPFNNNRKSLRCVLFHIILPYTQVYSVYIAFLQGKLYKRFVTQIYSFLTHNRKQRDYHSHSDKQPLEGEKKILRIFSSSQDSSEIPFFLHVIILLIRSKLLVLFVALSKQANLQRRQVTRPL